MLRCSTFGCDGLPNKQCSNCERILLCEGCIPNHNTKHLKENTTCILDEIKIKLPAGRLARLRENIEKSISNIEDQKKRIMSEALKMNCQDDIMVTSAFE
ncbi:hypothetical protein SteCoe_38966 [Stentor coeruleus]|uniref:C2H2-type domain-containing protein n=1 Tax=Stentor coeruleus TaxID=5963 RepID=A0A1R2AKY2_9CILI|nr:hypothetical protein SteCoe_38966 [Stentor coeruleus]